MIMGLKEEILEMKKEVQAVQEQSKNQSLAMELLQDSKRSNKRLAISFTIVLTLVLVLWSITICYLVYVLNDIGTEEITETNTQEVHDIDSVDNSYIINGDNNGNN